MHKDGNLGQYKDLSITSEFFKSHLQSVRLCLQAFKGALIARIVWVRAHSSRKEGSHQHGRR